MFAHALAPGVPLREPVCAEAVGGASGAVKEIVFGDLGEGRVGGAEEVGKRGEEDGVRAVAREKQKYRHHGLGAMK